MYGENPYSTPPTAAATVPATQRRIARYAQKAASARPSVTTRLYVTIAPNASVTGQVSTVTGSVYGSAHSRSKPVGLFMWVVISGLRPCPTANGTQPIAHIAWSGSGPSPTYVVAGAPHAEMVRRKARTTYAAETTSVGGIRTCRNGMAVRAPVTQRLAATSSATRRNRSTASGNSASAAATNGVTSNTACTASAVR